MNEPAEVATQPVAVFKQHQTTAEEREQWARRFTASGLSLRKFGAQHGLNWYSLWRWVDRHRQPAERSEVCELDPKTFEFTEIRLPESNWVAELSLPGGKLLRLSKDAPASLVEQLLRVC
jgi:hypothetical protein